MEKPSLDRVSVEIVRERFCGKVTSAFRRSTTQEEFDAAWDAHHCRGGKCKCKGAYKEAFVTDEPGYMYDEINCAVCGRGLGLS